MSKALVYNNKYRNKLNLVSDLRLYFASFEFDCKKLFNSN